MKNKRLIENQKQKQSFLLRSEVLKSDLSQERVELANLKMNLKREGKKQKLAEKNILESQNSIDQCHRKLKEITRNRDKLISDLDKGREKNKHMEIQNCDKTHQIEEIKRQLNILSSETKQILQKKDIISQKIMDEERKRIQSEIERSELKIRINKMINVEMSVKRKEHETQKRQKEALIRESDIVDRKKELCAKESSVIIDLINSSQITLKTLHHDLEALQLISMESRDNIQSLKEAKENERQHKDLASQKIEAALERLSDEEEIIQKIQVELENSDKLLKQKQLMCNNVKNECNSRSKVLMMNHEAMEKAKKEYNVIERQIIQRKKDIFRIEDDLVSEHFNHHHANEDKEMVRGEIENVKVHINELNMILEGHKKQIFTLHQSINNMDIQCDKFVKDYSIVMGYRDSIGNILLRKNEDLEKIKGKIKIQQSMIHHSKNDCQEQMSMVVQSMKKLEQLRNQKIVLKEDSITLDKYMIRCRHLEAEIQGERSKSAALKEEIGRPFNIHRWRTLELQSPQKFDKIQNIQKLQKQVIKITDTVAQKEHTLRDVEVMHFQHKHIFDQQPLMRDLIEQVSMYEGALKEKYGQMKNIEIDLTLTKNEVENMKKTLKALDTEREQIKSMWMDTMIQQ